MAVNILSNNVGVAGVLPAAENNHLVEFQNQVNTLTPEVKLDSLFEGNGFEKSVNSNFVPKLLDESELKPVNFNKSLTGAYEKLSQIKDSDVRHFLREDLQPLLENKELLNAYLGMMVGG